MDGTLTSEGTSLFAQLVQANQLGVRLEIVRGRRTCCSSTGALQSVSVVKG